MNPLVVWITLLTAALTLAVDDTIVTSDFCQSVCDKASGSEARSARILMVQLCQCQNSTIPQQQLTLTDDTVNPHKQHHHQEDATTAPTTTEDICVALCAAQLGGDACNCGVPSLPGKK